MNIYSYPKEHFWCVEAAERAGGFLSRFASAALNADAENYPILQSSVIHFMEKYPEYSSEQGAEKHDTI